MILLHWVLRAACLSWGFNLFGVPVTVIGEETIEDSVIYEEEDERDDIDDARDAWEDDDSAGYNYDRIPPKQKAWWRL